MEHKYIPKKQKWASDGYVGIKPMGAYYYNRTDEATLGLAIIFGLFILACAIRKRIKYSNKKTFIEKLKEKQERDLEKIRQIRGKLWSAVKDKRPGESEEQWRKRLKKYGFTPDGVHIKTGINYQ